MAFESGDPRSVAAMLLRRMADGVDADPGYNVGLAREVRQLLAYLSAADLTGSGEIDTRRVEFLRARIQAGVTE